MTIKARLLTLVAIFALVAAAISALGLKTISDYNRVIDGYTRVSDDAFRGERLNLLISQTVIELRNVYVAGTPAERDERIAQMTARITETTALLRDWQAARPAGEIEDLGRIATTARNTDAYCLKIVGIARTEGVAAAERIGLDPRAILSRESFQAKLDTLVAGIQQKLRARRASVDAYQARRTTDFLIVAGAGTALFLLVSLWIAIRSIANPIKTITGSIIRISEGAYDTVIPEHAADSGKTDEISRLWAAIAILKDRSVELKRLNDAKLELMLD